MIIEPGKLTVKEIAKQLSEWFPELRDRFMGMSEFFSPSFIAKITEKTMERREEMDEIIPKELESTFKHHPMFAFLDEMEVLPDIHSMLAAAVQNRLGFSSMIDDIEDERKRYEEGLGAIEAMADNRFDFSSIQDIIKEAIKDYKEGAEPPDDKMLKKDLQTRIKNLEILKSRIKLLFPLYESIVAAEAFRPLIPRMHENKKTAEDFLAKVKKSAEHHKDRMIESIGI